MQWAWGREGVLSGVGLVLLACIAGAAPASGPVATPPSTPFCTIARADDGFFAASSRVVRFPKGLEITILGLNHGNRDLRGGSADLLSKAKSRIDLRRLVLADPAATTDAREAARYLSTNLAYFSFVAAEASASTVTANLKTYASIRTRVLKFGSEAEEAMKLGFGADFYIRLSEPRSPKLIGVENEALGSAYLRSLPAMEKSAEVLKAAKFPTDTAGRLSDFLNSMAARYPSFQPDSDDFVREARAKFTAQDFAKIEPFLRARLAVMRAMKARDVHDVKVLLEQKSSGVLLIGRSHLDSIANLLREACVSADGRRASAAK
jgi:hypothetical protein